MYSSNVLDPDSWLVYMVGGLFSCSSAKVTRRKSACMLRNVDSLDSKRQARSFPQVFLYVYVCIYIICKMCVCTYLCMCVYILKCVRVASRLLGSF